jgi:hypothetical protein
MQLKVKKRMESKRAWLVTGLLDVLNGKLHLNRRLVVSVAVLGPTPGPGGKIYTVGPQYWSTHFSPLIGRITGTKVPGLNGKTERYKFVSMVLLHPPPFSSSPFSLQNSMPQHL